VATNAGAWWFSDRILLGMYAAHEVTEADAPELWEMVNDLARRAGLPMPRLYVLPQEAPNAFATGRNAHHAAVAVTQGALRLLPPEELRGVIAHELGHVANGDTLVSTIAATMAGAIGMLASMARWGMMFGGSRDDRRGGNPLAALVALVVAPLAALLVQMAISRSREYAADAYGAKLVGTGRPLAGALLRLDAWSRRIPSAVEPATAHLFIVNPLSAGAIASLFSTHPPTEERVRRLQQL
jgi:heat shock protein HtpX